MTDPEHFGAADLRKAHNLLMIALQEMRVDARQTRTDKKKMRNAKKLTDKAASLVDKAERKLASMRFP